MVVVHYARSLILHDRFAAYWASLLVFFGCEVSDRRFVGLVTGSAILAVLVLILLKMGRQHDGTVANFTYRQAQPYLLNSSSERISWMSLFSRDMSSVK